MRTDGSTGKSGGMRLARVSLAALGIVYGDIGTSPLYAVHECFFGSGTLPADTTNVLGVLSLIFWSLVLVISVKYLAVVMRADNRGEGGILALLALLDPWRRSRGRSTALLAALGTFGAALLYGDGMLTPAISVLSAVEGLEVAAPALRELVLPVTIAILLLLFLFQRRGSARIGSVFGPVMIVWFAVLGLLGAVSIAHTPEVLAAIDPLEAIRFIAAGRGTAFLVLGGVFLVVTGGEALYADMGHFGARAIRIAWFAVVLPGLLLNYFGQGAYVLAHPGAAEHPFYTLVPHWGIYPMIALATVATVIASQAVISGTFSLMRQAIQLDQSPRLEVVQTSPEEIGQIYVPTVNWMLLVATVSLVVGFGSSSRLAAAYGVAISVTMVVTTLLLFFVMREQWRWRFPLALVVCGAFLIGDLSFLGANLFKVVDGGWFPLAVGGIGLLLMSTWRRGRTLLAERSGGTSMPIEVLLATLAADPPRRVRGTAVFLTAPGERVPRGLLHHLKINQVLHEQVVLLTVITEDVPRIEGTHRMEVKELGFGFQRVLLRYGFMQSPDIPLALAVGRERGLLPTLESEHIAYFAGHMVLLPTPGAGTMPRWRKSLFAFMARNAQRAAEFYRLPPGRSVELGIQVES